MPADVVNWIHENRDPSVRQLVEFLRHPSVSTDPDRAAAMTRCCDWLAERLRQIGLTVRVESADGGHPAVIAERCRRPGRPTLLIYGHYDVQPPEPLDLWRADPFDPQVRDGNITARGATDDKGQLFTHVKALEAWLAVAGELPVNVRMLIEGEEEIGSPTLPALLVRHRDRLAADVVVISDTAMYAAGTPSICEGLRGLVYLDVVVRGPARDLHSGHYGGQVTGPALALAKLLAALKADNGWITIPGFYDDVKPVPPARRAQWAALAPSEDEVCRRIGVEELRGEPGYGVLERVWGRPSLDVNGLWGGYAGPGSKTVIPALAGAKLSMRLVPDQDPDRIAAATEAYLRDLARIHFGRSVSLEFRRHTGAHPVLVPTDSPAQAAAAKALEAGFGKPPVFVRSGGTIPVVRTFKDQMGLDSLLMGYGSPDDNAHGPNEKFSLADFHRGTLSNAHLLELAASLPCGGRE